MNPHIYSSYCYVLVTVLSIQTEAAHGCHGQDPTDKEGKMDVKQDRMDPVGKGPGKAHGAYRRSYGFEARGEGHAQAVHAAALRPASAKGSGQVL